MDSILLACLLVAAALAVIPLQPAHADTTTLSVYSNNTDSQAIYGYYITLYQGGSVVGTGFTPTQFSLVSGQTYSIYAANYGSCVFAYWIVPVPGGANDDPSNPYTFTAPVTENLLSAAYNCSSSGGSGTSQLTINTQDISGNPISGFYTVLNQSNTIVATGFTPHAFTLNNGQTYTVQVDSYGSCQFDHWQDIASRTFYRTVSISTNTQYTAVMNCGGTSNTATVQSFDQYGNQIYGYYTVFYRCFQGACDPVSSGFTTVTFSTVCTNYCSGVYYAVSVANYGGCTFSHWVDDGSTNSFKTFGATGAAFVFKAVYSCA